MNMNDCMRFAFRLCRCFMVDGGRMLTADANVSNMIKRMVRYRCGTGVALLLL